MQKWTLGLIGATVVTALVAWPVFGSGSAERSRPVPAAVLPDYLYRDKTIAFFEQRVARDPADQISARMLAQQYMQRFREAGDIGDIQRSLKQAHRSIDLQAGDNPSAYESLASAETALHRFRTALADERIAHDVRSDDINAVGQIASLDMELGHYQTAGRIIGRAAEHHPGDPSLLAILARYEEETGNLQAARTYLERGSEIMDSVLDNSAQGRAWFHFREGELAFSAGDNAAAERAERDALAIFPHDAQAFNALARFCWASKDWPCALAAATNGAAIIPLPETLGYEADAQRALGNAAGGARTDALIVAIERIGNAYHTSDRLLAVSYSEHGIRLDDALRIARREIRVRGNEIYAQDTLAWAAAMDGHWNEALHATHRALRYNTEDARLQYHAGAIALHFGDRAEAKRRFERALALNAAFHPVYADDARKQLRTL